LFAGSGASGSELADTIAEYLFPERKALLRFAGSELTDAEAQDRLVGPRLTCCFGKHTEHAPQPVTHLTHRVLCDPKRVIVFDDIERACPEVVRLILLMMTEGSLTEPSYGKVAEFNHSIVILTSSLECPDIYKLHPGLEGSIDRVCVFEPPAGVAHEPEVTDDGRI
jgi:ATP-dependent Clp protease ATP-binding subunit ClpA